MKGRAIIPLVVGLGIGLFAVRSFLSVLSKAKGSGPVEAVEVVRAGANIAATAEIRPEMLETVAVPKELVPEGAFTDPEDLVGRVTCNMVPAGIPIVPALLAPEGTLPGMSSRIPAGYRAVALQVDEVKGVGGWLNQGCRVDVVMVAEVEHNGRRQGTISKVVLQDVEVLAVGQKEVTEGPKPSVTRSVTLLVKPDDATKLALAGSKGNLRLTMRNTTDDMRPRNVTLTDKDLMQDKPPDDRPDAYAAGGGSTILGRLFGKESKIGGQQTDKQDTKASVGAQEGPVQVAVAPRQDWVVDVLLGPQAYQVRFDSDERDARQIRYPQGGPAYVPGPVGGPGAMGPATHRDVDGASSSAGTEDDEEHDAPPRE